MKKSIVVILIVVSLIAGYLFGINTVIMSRKWVEKEAGLNIICTEIFGHVFTDVADKNSEHYNYFSFEVARR